MPITAICSGWAFALAARWRTTCSGPTPPAATAASPRCHPAPPRRFPPAADGQPDFGKMSPAEKAQWNLKRWKRILG